MKIRIKGDSLRLRLDKADIDVLHQEGKVEESTSTAGMKFCYGLEESTVHTNLFASADNNKITVFIPKQMSEEWSVDDIVGFDFLQENEDGTSLKLLVEKDFKCLTPRNEDESNAFPNPQEKHSC